MGRLCPHLFKTLLTWAWYSIKQLALLQNWSMSPLEHRLAYCSHPQILQPRIAELFQDRPSSTIVLSQLFWHIICSPLARQVLKPLVCMCYQCNAWSCYSPGVSSAHASEQPWSKHVWRPKSMSAAEHTHGTCCMTSNIHQSLTTDCLGLHSSLLYLPSTQSVASYTDRGQSICGLPIICECNNDLQAHPQHQ